MSSNQVTKRQFVARPEPTAGMQAGANPDIYWYPTLDFGKDVIEPGTMVRFKNRRGVYKFRGLYHNKKLDVTWVDCFEEKTGRMRAFYVDELKSVVKPKRSRVKKLV
jgi:hypothetical protein